MFLKMRFLVVRVLRLGVRCELWLKVDRKLVLRFLMVIWMMLGWILGLVFLMKCRVLCGLLFKWVELLVESFWWMLVKEVLML